MTTTQPAWDGARNLADLGGVALRDGGVTASGRVYRSAAREWMTGAGWEVAATAGLARVVDLRNAVEHGRRPEHPVLDAEPGVEVIDAPLEDPDDQDYLDELGPWLDHPRAWEPMVRRFPELTAHAMAAVADAPGPVLVHCAGGRDRTGLVAAMLFALAGADPAAAAADYGDGFRVAAEYRWRGMSYDPVTGGWAHTDDSPLTADELDEAVAARLPQAERFVAEFDVAAHLSAAGLDDRRLTRLGALLR